MQVSKPEETTSNFLRIPFPSSYRIPSISEHSGTFNIPFNAGSVRLPLSLSSVVVGDLRKALDKCSLAALIAHNSLQAIHKEREQRYWKLCPNDLMNKELYREHASSVDRLFAWCTDYINGPYNPTLAPTARIPYFGVRLVFNRNAYAEWSGNYRRMGKDFENMEYKEYQRARKNFETMMYVAKAKGTISAEEFHELERFWKGCFMLEMKKWEDEVSKQLELPTYEVVTQEVLTTVLNSVEHGESVVWEMQGQQLSWSSTPNYYGYFPGL